MQRLDIMGEGVAIGVLIGCVFLFGFEIWLRFCVTVAVLTDISIAFMAHTAFPVCAVLVLCVF